MLALIGCLLFAPPSTVAEGPEPADTPARAWTDYRRTAAFEVNLLWPFFPGGIVDFKLLIPALRPDRHVLRGEAVLGLQSDFGWRFIRDDPDEYGRVSILSLKLGWRQFIAWGLHLDATVNAGWRNEVGNPHADGVINSFQGRFWGFAGYQHEFGPRVYLNLRGGVGVHLWRTDELRDRERVLTGGGDLNLGLRF